MHNRQVKVASLILLAVFLFNTCLFGVFLTIRLHAHQQNQYQNLHSHNRADLLELRIPAMLIEQPNSELVWKKNWEFCYHGEMYDVVTSDKCGDEYVMKVKHDSKESKLRRQIERKTKEDNESRDSRSKKNLKVNALFCISESDLQIPLQNVRIKIQAPEHTLTELRAYAPYSPPWNC